MLDCQSCGSCCVGPGTWMHVVILTWRDLLRLPLWAFRYVRLRRRLLARREGGYSLPRPRIELAIVNHPDGNACALFEGRVGGPCGCRIYAHRPQVCREFGTRAGCESWMNYVAKARPVPVEAHGDFPEVEDDPLPDPEVGCAFMCGSSTLFAKFVVGIMVEDDDWFVSVDEDGWYVNQGTAWLYVGREDDPCSDPDVEFDCCEICDQPVDWTGECSMCGMPVCNNCVVHGDDAFPELCTDCAEQLEGEEGDG